MTWQPASTRPSLLRMLHGEGDLPWGADPARFDPAMVGQTMDRLGWLYRPGGYFDVQVEGWENLPPGPSLIVMNHSGGTTVPDVWGLAYAWYSQHPQGRPLRPLAHDMVFSSALTGRPFERMGLLRACKKHAHTVLTELRQDVLVLPGGDVETWRPWTRRYEVEFGGRQGYIRSALDAGVPIVPVSHAGAHDTLMVLSRGDRLARRLGLHDLARADIFPVSLSLPWGLTVGPMPHWPLPGPLRYRIGAPVAVPALEGEAPSDELVDRLDAEVQARVQAGLDALKATRSPRRARVGDLVDRLLGGASA